MQGGHVLGRLLPPPGHGAQIPGGSFLIEQAPPCPVVSLFFNGGHRGPAALAVPPLRLLHAVSDQQEDHIRRQAHLVPQVRQPLYIHGSEFFAQGALRLLHQHPKLRVPEHFHQLRSGVLPLPLGRLRYGQALGLNKPHILQLALGRLQAQGAHGQILHQPLRRHGIRPAHEVQI